jgi:LysR family transcriptional regulator, transcriptional activator AphB
MSRPRPLSTRPLSIDDLRLVIAVARHGSFVTAARGTGVPSSTVSRAVARLEDSLGVRFFQRSSRSVSLTDEGLRLVERAAPLFEELGDVIDGLVDRSSEPSGRLRITAPTVTGTGWLGRALLSFAKAHPRVAVELSLSNAVVDLVEEGVDLAFRAGPIEDAGLIARRILSVPYSIGASRGFIEQKLGKRRSLGRSLLSSLPAVLASPGTLWSFVRADGTRVKVQPQAAFHVNDLRVAVDAARWGLGLVRAPTELIQASGLAMPSLAPDLGTPVPRDLYAVYPTRRLVPRRVRLAIDWVARAANASREDAGP